MADFLCECFDIYYHTEQKVRIREFDNVLLKLYGHGKKGCVFGDREECGSFISVSPDGKVGVCDAYEADTHVIGNIWSQTLEDIVNSDIYQKIKELYITLVSNECKDCEWKCVCGCGCARNDIGEGKERKSYFCETYKRLYQHIVNTVRSDERLKDENSKMTI